jgi:hypothetical protein
MAVKFTNNAKTTLASGINSTATSATVADGSVFPTLEAGEYFYCTFDDDTNNEIVKVTARSSNTLTIVRGVDNTTARAFLSGDAAELRATSALLTDIQANIAAKSANQTVYNATTASSATAYDIGIDPGVEGNAMVFLNGLMQHHDTFSFSGSTLTLDTAPADGMALEVIVDNLINLQSSNLTVDTFTAADVGGNPQVDFTLSDAPAAETNLIVFVDGVFQANDTYTISNLTLSMTDGVTAGLTVTVYVMNPVNIGAPSDGTVTTSKLSGNITMPGTLTVGAFDVAFDSPTFFVDHTNSRVGLGTATPSVPVDIVGEVKISSHLNMPDNAIAKFGTGADLQIYHDGTASWLRDVSIGDLYLDTNGTKISLISDGIYATGKMADFVKDGAVTLYHDNAAKLATTSTGIDVTGTATMDGLTVDGLITLAGSTSGNRTVKDSFLNGALSNQGFLRSSGGNYWGYSTYQDGSANWKSAVSVASERAVYAMDEDTAYWSFAPSQTVAIGSDLTTQPSEKIRFDLQNGRVGIGTSSPVVKLTTESGVARTSTAKTETAFFSSTDNDDFRFGLAISHKGGTTDADRYASLDSTAYRISTDSFAAGGSLVLQELGGNVGIGTSSPAYNLHVEKLSASGNVDLLVKNTGTDGTSNTRIMSYVEASGGDPKIGLGITGVRDYFFRIDNSDSDKLKLDTNGSDIVTIDTSGNVGIGTSSPSSYTGASANTLVVGTNVGNNGITIVGATTGYSSLAFADSAGAGTTADYSGLIQYYHNTDNMNFFTVGSERLRINSDGALVLQEGNPIYADTGRVVNFGVPASYGNALNFATLGGLEAATGFYLVTVVRNGASVGSNWIGLIGVSTSGASYIYNVIYANGISAQMSGSWLQLQSASTIYVHITAVPIGITGNDT